MHFVLLLIISAHNPICPNASDVADYLGKLSQFFGFLSGFYREKLSESEPEFSRLKLSGSESGFGTESSTPQGTISDA